MYNYCEKCTLFSLNLRKQKLNSLRKERKNSSFSSLQRDDPDDNSLNNYDPSSGDDNVELRITTAGAKCRVNCNHYNYSPLSQKHKKW